MSDLWWFVKWMLAGLIGGLLAAYILATFWVPLILKVKEQPRRVAAELAILDRPIRPQP